MPQAIPPEAVLVQLRHGRDIGWGEEKEPVRSNGQAIDEQTENHDETESDQTAWLLDKDRGS